MGIHPSTFYRWRAQMLRFGPEPVDEQWKVVELRVKASVGLDPLRPSFGLWWGGRSSRGRTRSPPAFGDRPRESITGERNCCHDPWPGYTPLSRLVPSADATMPPAADVPSDDRLRSPLPVPGLRPATPLARRAPRVHWADGGRRRWRTSCSCRRHHQLIHRPRGFRLDAVDAPPVFRRPTARSSGNGRGPAIAPTPLIAVGLRQLQVVVATTRV